MGLIHTQEFRFEKNKTPTSVVESYKTTYGHKAVVLMSVVEGRAENICSLRAFPVLTQLRHWAYPHFSPIGPFVARLFVAKC